MSTLKGTGDYSWGGNPPGPLTRLGTWAGNKLGGWLGGITGTGDYENTGPIDPMPNIQTPTVRNESDRSVVISHKEYIGDVITSPDAGDFRLMSFMVNPGNPSCFPWLSQLAPCFQEYQLNGCLFHFKSMSADALNSTNTALGQVVCATNYNVAQKNYESKFEMENTEFGSSSKPSVSFMHPIECDRRINVLGNLYVAPGGVPPPGSDPQFYNHANFQIATNGFQGSSVNVGELWVTYEVILRKPIQPEGQGASGGLVLYWRTGPRPISPAGSSITAGHFTTPLLFSSPPGILNPTNLSGLDYYVTSSGNKFTITSANSGEDDTSLVGRCFNFRATISTSSSGMFTDGGSLNGAVILSPNLGNWVGSVNAISMNGSGNSWLLFVQFRPIKKGPLEISWDSSNSFMLSGTSLSASVSLSEIPANSVGL